MISPPKKSKQLTFNLADVNRPPSHVEMSIRATYGLALGNPTQPRVDALKNLSVVPLSSTQLGEMKEREEAAREAPRMAGRVPGRDELESVHGPVRAIDRQIATRTTRQKVVKRNILDSDSDSASDDESLGSDPSDIADSAPETHDLPVQEELVDPLTAFLKAHLGPSTDSQIYVNATVRAAALTQLHAQANAAAARTIQSAYRSWTSKQLVLGWVSFSQMSLSDPTKQSTAKEKKHVFVPPPNAFQERLSTRAYKRLQSRQLRMILHTWHTLVASFKRIRLRILVCHTARKMSRKIVGWQRVVVRQMALKSVVYIQERVVRMRHFRLWRGLTIIKRNMFWCMRRALHAMKHYICGAAVEVRDRWEHVFYHMRNLWAANYIKYWYKGVSIRKWYLRYTKAAFTVKDEIMRRLGKEVLEMRMAVELERLSRERATMKKISRRAVAALREYIATEEGADEFNIYWRIIRKHRREIKRVELRKLRLLKKRPKSVSGEVAQIIDIKYYDAKELYKDYVKTDWREPAYTCCEERINYESRKVSRENFRREQPPSYDCECCKKPFVFNFLLRRHKLIYDGECEPKVPSHLEWVKADKFSKAAMQRIVDIFYSHLVADRLKGKRGASAAMEASSGGAGMEGRALEGVGAEEKVQATKGWGKVKMAVGDDNMVEGGGGGAFAGGFSSLKSKFMMAKLKAAELVEQRMEEEEQDGEGEEEEEEEEEEEIVLWVAAKDHPVFKKFFGMVKVIGEASVKKRMDALKYDPSVLDEPGCMIGLENSVYKDRRVPAKILEGEEDSESQEEEVVEKPWFESDSSGGKDEGDEEEDVNEETKEKQEKMKAKLGGMFKEGKEQRDKEMKAMAGVFVMT